MALNDTPKKLFKVKKAERVDPTCFQPPGRSFRGKLIGMEDVAGPRGDKMCQVAMAKLKAATRAMGDHKLRIIINISFDGIKLIDEKTEAIIQDHRLTRISFISRDIGDSRAFGYIYNHGEGYHFYGIKMEKTAETIVSTIQNLFQVVYEMSLKKEVDDPKPPNVSIPQKEETTFAEKIFIDSDNQAAARQPLPSNTVPSIASFTERYSTLPTRSAIKPSSLPLHRNATDMRNSEAKSIQTSSVNQCPDNTSVKESAGASAQDFKPLSKKVSANRQSTDSLPTVLPPPAKHPTVLLRNQSMPYGTTSLPRRSWRTSLDAETVSKNGSCSVASGAVSSAAAKGWEVFDDVFDGSVGGPSPSTSTHGGEHSMCNDAFPAKRFDSAAWNTSENYTAQEACEKLVPEFSTDGIKITDSSKLMKKCSASDAFPSSSVSSLLRHPADQSATNKALFLSSGRRTSHSNDVLTNNLGNSKCESVLDAVNANLTTSNSALLSGAEVLTNGNEHASTRGTETQTNPPTSPGSVSLPSPDAPPPPAPANIISEYSTSSAPIPPPRPRRNSSLSNVRQKPSNTSRTNTVTDESSGMMQWGQLSPDSSLSLITAQRFVEPEISSISPSESNNTRVMEPVPMLREERKYNFSDCFDSSLEEAAVNVDALQPLYSNLPWQTHINNSESLEAPTLFDKHSENTTVTRQHDAIDEKMQAISNLNCNPESYSQSLSPKTGKPLDDLLYQVRMHVYSTVPFSTRPPIEPIYSNLPWEMRLNPSSEDTVSAADKNQDLTSLLRSTTDVPSSAFTSAPQEISCTWINDWSQQSLNVMNEPNQSHAAIADVQFSKPPPLPPRHLAALKKRKQTTADLTTDCPNTVGKHAGMENVSVSKNGANINENVSDVERVNDASSTESALKIDINNESLTVLTDENVCNQVQTKLTKETDATTVHAVAIHPPLVPQRKSAALKQSSVNKSPVVTGTKEPLALSIISSDHSNPAPLLTAQCSSSVALKVLSSDTSPIVATTKTGTPLLSTASNQVMSSITSNSSKQACAANSLQFVTDSSQRQSSTVTNRSQSSVVLNKSLSRDSIIVQVSIVPRPRPRRRQSSSSNTSIDTRSASLGNQEQVQRTAVLPTDTSFQCSQSKQPFSAQQTTTTRRHRTSSGTVSSPRDNSSRAPSSSQTDRDRCSSDTRSCERSLRHHRRSSRRGSETIIDPFQGVDPFATESAIFGDPFGGLSPDTLSAGMENQLFVMDLADCATEEDEKSLFRTRAVTIDLSPKVCNDFWNTGERSGNWYDFSVLSPDDSGPEKAITESFLGFDAFTPVRDPPDNKLGDKLVGKHEENVTDNQNPFGFESFACFDAHFNNGDVNVVTSDAVSETNSAVCYSTSESSTSFALEKSSGVISNRLSSATSNRVFGLTRDTSKEILPQKSKSEIVVSPEIRASICASAADKTKSAAAIFYALQREAEIMRRSAKEKEASQVAADDTTAASAPAAVDISPLPDSDAVLKSDAGVPSAIATPTAGTVDIHTAGIIACGTSAVANSDADPGAAADASCTTAACSLTTVAVDSYTTAACPVVFGAVSAVVVVAATTLIAPEPHCTITTTACSAFCTNTTVANSDSICTTVSPDVTPTTPATTAAPDSVGVLDITLCPALAAASGATADTFNIQFPLSSESVKLKNNIVLHEPMTNITGSSSLGCQSTLVSVLNFSAQATVPHKSMSDTTCPPASPPLETSFATGSNSSPASQVLIDSPQNFILDWESLDQSATSIVNTSVANEVLSSTEPTNPALANNLFEMILDDFTHRFPLPSASRSFASQISCDHEERSSNSDVKLSYANETTVTDHEPSQKIDQKMPSLAANESKDISKVW